MKKIISILAVVIIFTGVLFAANKEAPISTTNVIGSVIDKNTGESLVGVKVVLSELNETVYTDFDGNFEFKQVKLGKYTIRTDLISYEDKTVSVDLKKSTDVKIEVEN
jgi:iron complex outermembrane receptor protein